MTFEEAKKAIDGFKENGRTDEEIVATFYLMFQDDKINVEELKNLVGLVGYELTDEFLAMSPEDQKTKVFEEEDEGEPSSNKDSDKESSEDEKETKDSDKESEEKPTEEKIESDDTQEEKALKLFGLK